MSSSPSSAIPDKEEIEEQQMKQELLNKMKEEGGGEEETEDYTQEQHNVLTTTTTNITSVSEALRLHSGFVKVTGMITSLSQLYKMITSSRYNCINCDYQDTTTYEKPLLIPNKELKKRCPSCHETFEISHDFINAVTVELQDTDTFSEIERLPVVLFDNDTKNIHVGERVIVSGNIHVILRKGKPFLPFLYANSIEYESREEISLTAQDIEAIGRYAKIRRRGGEEEDNSVIDRLVALFAPSVIGYDHVKQGLLLCAANSGNDTPTKRNRLHAILVGDPGLAKSALLREATKLVPNSRAESGQNSSGKSLTAIVSKEDESYILRLGPASLAKGAICAVNELGRISYEDQAYLLDIAEEGEYTINKHGINAKINAPTTIIASANPVNNSTFTNEDRIDLDEIPAIKPLIDRFDLLFVFRTNRNSENIRKYAYEKSELDRKRILPDYYNFLRKYILYSKRFNPILNEEAKAMLNEYWIDLAKRFGSPRILETLFRLAKATARLKLKHVVDAEDAKETMQFYNVILQQHQQVVSIPSNPREIAFNECVNILKDSRFAISFEELVRTACERNEHVRRYLNAKFKLQDNIKLRPLLDMLLNHSSLKMIQHKPMVLQWIDCNDDRIEKENLNNESESKDSNTPTLYDAYDVYDTQRHQLNQKFNENFIIQLQQTTPTQASYASYTSYSRNDDDISNRTAFTDITTKDSSFLYSCYYCGNFETNTKQGYEIHVVNTHPRKLCYPSKADLEILGIHPKGKEWEK
jgi:replicative DNA helicase Mcm